MAWALGGAGLVALAQGIAQASPDFAWVVSLKPAWGLPLGALLGWALSRAAAWALQSGLPWGRRVATALLASAILGFLGPWVGRMHLPPPHDIPVRPLQIWMAALLTAGLAWAWALTLALLWRRDDAGRRPHWTLWRLFGLAWLSYMACAPWISRWTNTGDAPHYLMMTEAMAEHGSTDLGDAYSSRRWLRYYDRDDLQEQAQPVDGHHYPLHRPGLAILLAPGWKLLGPWGARWLHTLFTAAAGALLFWVLIADVDSRRALAGWALFALSAPWLMHAPGMMSEALPGLAWLFALAAWRDRTPAWLAFLGAGALTWMNVRFYPVAALLALQSAWFLRSWRWRGLLLSGSLALGALALNAHQYGSWHPLASFQHNQVGADQLYLWRRIGWNAAGLWIDQEYGLLTWAPAFVLAAAGLRRRWAHAPVLAAHEAAGFLLYLAPLTLVLWWHGDMAPARYLIPAVPLLALWSAEALDWRSWGQRALLGATAALAWLMAALPWLCYSKQQGQNLLLRLLGERLGFALTPLAPSFIIIRSSSTVWALLALLLLLASVRVWGRPSR